MRYSLDEIKILSQEYAKSRHVTPRLYHGKPEELFVIIHHGDLLGMTPMEAMLSLSMINGKLTMWGDALPALALSSGELEKLEEHFIGSLQDETLIAHCIIKRKGINEKETTFSLDDAKKAGLWNPNTKSNLPWYKYTKRMLQIRARSFALRDIFADRLKGIIAREEAMDYVMEKKPEKKPTQPIDKPKVNKIDDTKKIINNNNEPNAAEILTKDRFIDDLAVELSKNNEYKDGLSADDRLKIFAVISDLADRDDKDSSSEEYANSVKELKKRALKNPIKFMEIVNKSFIIGTEGRGNNV